LAAYDTDVYPYKLVAVRASLVGQNGVEAGKSYRLTIAGEFEEVTE
jgi:GH18 family chitinase